MLFSRLRRRLRSGLQAGAALVLLGALIAPLAHAAPVRVDAVEAELIADRDAVVPGEPLRLGLRLKHQEHWHTYWQNPGDSGLPTQFDLKLPEGFEAGPIQWPAPQRVFIPPLANYGYEGEIVLPRPIRVPARIEASRIDFHAHAQWLVCREVCVPGEADLALSLPVRQAGPAGPGPWKALFERTDALLPARTVAADFAVAADGMLSIVLPADALGKAPARAEFFALREGTIDHAAAQRLYHLSDGRWRLELPLADALRSVPPDRQAEAVRGVLRVAGRAPIRIEPAARVVVAGGDLVAQVDGVPARPVREADAAERLLDAAGLGPRPVEGVTLPGPPAGAAASPPAGTATPASESLLSGATGSVGGLGAAIAFGVLGGLILNLMPCVFPVIGLKVLGFAGHGAAGQRLDAAARRRVRRGTAWFAIGVLVSFWLLAAVLLGLRSAGEAAGWGFQLQSPVFVFAMALLFVAIGLNLSGLFEFGTVLTRLGNVGGDEDRHPVASSFASGVLAVLVATPCTAPFMGSALGFTLTQPVPQAMAVFTAIGVGMALPYVVLGTFPGWLRVLPRPGRWMETFRELLAFPMYAAAAWLAWVLGRQSGVDATLAFAVAAIALALVAWAWGRFLQGRASRPVRVAAALLVLAGLGVVVRLGMVVQSSPPAAAQLQARSADSDSDSDAGSALAWRDWSPEAVETAVAQGHPVFVDFTAAWCVSCQVNERFVIESDAVRAAFARYGVVALRGDWTRQDPTISAELARFGRNGVPMYLVYGPRLATPRLLPELLTSELVVDAVRDAARP